MPHILSMLSLSADMKAMGIVLRVLIVEDSADDAELATLALEEGGYHVVSEVVATEEAYLDALDGGSWDVVLSDHNLPGFDSIKALKLLQARGLDIPFIIVSGAIGEEVAVTAMKAGASDYLMKDRLARLAPAVERELREVAARRERRNAREALSLSQARLSGIIATAMDAIISVDAEHRIVLFNPAAERMFGYAVKEVLEQPLDLLLPARYRERHREHIAHFGETGVTARAMGALMTLAALRRDGEEFPIEATISQIDVSGERYYTVIVRDVTDRVRAEREMAAALREKELLVREVHHRVKNNLHVVASLLALQADTAEDPVAARALLDGETRVRAMGLVHDKLHVSENSALVDFGEYLHTFVPELVRLYCGDSNRISLRIEADNARFSVDVASPLALIVNELVTNALKYAFPDGRGGAIVVVAHPNDAGPILTVQDSGIGIPDEALRSHSSFGLELVATLTEQLGCRMDVDTSSGTTVTLIQERAQ